MTPADRKHSIERAEAAVKAYYADKSAPMLIDLLDVICDLLLWADAMSDETTHFDCEEILRDATINYRNERDGA